MGNELPDASDGKDGRRMGLHVHDEQESRMYPFIFFEKGIEEYYARFRGFDGKSEASFLIFA